MTAAAPLSTPPPLEVQVRFPARMTEVRLGLAQLLASPALSDLDDEDRGTAELLLAEALNNIVEHAYARWPGDIAVALDRSASHVAVRILDQGLPMPDAAPPKGALPEIGAIEDLPEGGFGWFLIRSLAFDLTYRRQGDSNELCFCIPVNNWDAEGAIGAQA